MDRVSDEWIDDWLQHCEDVLKDPPNMYDGYSFLIVEQESGAVGELRSALTELKLARIFVKQEKESENA